MGTGAVKNILSNVRLFSVPVKLRPHLSPFQLKHPARRLPAIINRQLFDRDAAGTTLHVNRKSRTPGNGQLPVERKIAIVAPRNATGGNLQR